MVIPTNAIVSNSDMLKNYKACREKVEQLTKLFIMKNNKPDAVLFSISEYERLSGFIEYAEYLEKNEIANILEAIPKTGDFKSHSMGLIRKDVDQMVAVDIIAK